MITAMPPANPANQTGGGSAHPTVLYIGSSEGEATRFREAYGGRFEVISAWKATQALKLSARHGVVFDLVLNAAPPTSALGLDLVYSLRNELLLKQPILWLAGSPFDAGQRAQLHRAGVAGVLALPLVAEQLAGYLPATRPALGPAAPASGATGVAPFRLPLGKRLFDIAVVLSALTVLSPLLLLVAALIKLESRGPVLYFSYRVGTGYQVFKFWKFRSMRADADQQLSLLKGKNQYGAAAPLAPAEALGTAAQLCAACAAAGTGCQQQLVDGKGQLICEKTYRQQQQQAAEPVFLKVANDPRVTRLGRILRNTSIDELPQLFNILSGNMSIVGNRPLPLYEAEKLTTDESAIRFLAPAGLTGLWQVSRRGQSTMSEDERKALDRKYALNYSLRLDLQILWKTIPALFQKENV